MKHKLLFCVAIIFTIIVMDWRRNIYFSDIRSFIQHKGLRVAITAPAYFRAEVQTCKRMANVLKENGYCPVVFARTYFPLFFPFDFDFTINTWDRFHVNKNYYNFLIMHKSSQKTPHGFDAVLSVLPVQYSRKIITDTPILPFYLSEHATEFFDAPKRKLFFCNSGWDLYRREYCEKLYKLLDKTGYFEAYGLSKFWNKLKIKSYRGFIPQEKDAVLKVMQKAGISLVLHSPEHFDENTTTARIFESLAASNVIICDRLPFIVENFGDTVLYIDRNASPEEMFRQIDNHMQWILSHQKEAIEMARKAHNIFLEKFALEKLLQNVIDFYEKHKDDKVNNKRKL